jgi:multidrug resistance protein
MPKMPVFDRRLLTILSIVFVQIAGAALILPILPLFAEREFSMSPATISLLVSSYFMAVFFAGPMLGQLSDRYGRVPILLISQIGSAISFFMMAAAGAVWVLFAARILDGITGGNIIVAQAYVTDVTPRDKRTEALGYIFASFGLAFIIGPALGGVLAAWFGPRVPFVIAGLASIATALMVKLLLRETVTRAEAGQALPPRRVLLPPGEIARNSSLVLILLVAFIGQFGLGILQAVFALYAAAVLFAGLPPDSINLGVGMLFATIGLGQFITQLWLIKPLKARFGDARLVIIGSMLRTAGLVIYAVFTSPWMGGVGSILFAIGQGLMMPPLQALSTRTVPDSVRGSVLGVYQSAVSLAIIISTAIGGAIYMISITLPLWVAVGMSVLGLLPAFVVLRRAHRFELQEHPAPGD